MSAAASRPLSICLFTDVSLPLIGGAQTVLDQLARQLVAAGHRPVVVAPAPRQAWDDRRLGYTVVRHRRPWSKRFGVRAILPRLLLLQRRHRFDLVHCHAAYPQAFIASSLRRICGLPYVVRPHGADVLPGEVIRRSPRLERRMRQGIRGADAVIAQGGFLRGVIADLGVDTDRIRVINNGVDLGAFAGAEPFVHPRPYLLGIGSLVPHKGFDLLIRALPLLPDGPDLLLAGDGPEAAALASLAASLGVADRVRFLGPVTGRDKVALYRSAACVVCPSRREPFANVILEALAAGRPVVATDVGGNREMVHSGVNGLLCGPESPSGLADAVRRVIDQPGLAASLAAAARPSVAAHDWPEVAARYVAVYREVVAGAG